MHGLNNYPRIAILGAGLAGLSTAVFLSKNKIPVSIYEKTLHGGGKTFSWWDRQNQSVLDNGQHILMGCYHTTFELLKEIGSFPLLDMSNRLQLHFYRSPSAKSQIHIKDEDGLLYFFKTLKNIRGINIREILRLCWMVKDIFFPKRLERFWSLEAWLDVYHVPYWVRQILWQPLILSATNEWLSTASVHDGLNVFRNIFFGPKKNCDILLPKNSLTQLFVQPCMDYLSQNSVQLCLGQEIHKILLMPNGQYKIELKNKIELVDIIICTIPAHELYDILPDSWQSLEIFQNIRKIMYTSIITAYLWTSQKIMEQPYLGLLDTELAQFIFDRTDNIAKKGFCYSIVISGSDMFLSWSSAQLKDQVVRDLKNTIPDFQEKYVQNIKIVKEAQATHCDQEVFNKFRPEPGEIMKNFYLAGAWTQTYLPSTIEGAIYSGKKVADIMLKNCKL